MATKLSHLHLVILEVAEELLDGLVCFGMTDHLREKLRRNGDYISASYQGFIDIADMSDAADDNLARRPTLFENLVNALDDGAGVVADIFNSVVEEADEIGTRQSTHQDSYCP